MLRVRPWIAADKLTLLTWANNKETRENSIDPKPIIKDAHETWFRTMLARPETEQGFLCVDARSRRVGVVRFSRKSPTGKDWEIHFTLAPRQRGKGLARPMLRQAFAGFKKNFPSSCLTARVKASNKKSLQVLKSLGFQETRKAGGVLCLRQALGQRVLRGLSFPAAKTRL